MKAATRHPLPRPEFEQMSAHQHEHTVSIYLPMDLKGHEQNQHLAQGRLKQCLKEIREELAARDMESREITTFLKPLETLLTDVSLWRNPSEGLGLFLAPGQELKVVRVPIAVALRCYVGKRYLLSPLLPLYQMDKTYYLLELSQDYVKLFAATRFELSDMHLDEVAPSRLEDAVGYDYEQKSLQFRTGQGGQSANFHGQGAGKDEERKEILSFFRKVSEGVGSKVQDSQCPIVLACVDALVPIYRKVHSQTNPIAGHIPGDPEFRKDSERHQLSWKAIEPYFEEGFQEKSTQIGEFLHTERTSDEEEIIVSEAINGRVDTLFIAEDYTLYGRFDPEENAPMLSTKRKKGDTSLSDLAAVQTFLKGGHVFTLPESEMPFTDSGMIALFRY